MSFRHLSKEVVDPVKLDGFSRNRVNGLVLDAPLGSTLRTPTWPLVSLSTLWKSLHGSVRPHVKQLQRRAGFVRGALHLLHF